MIWLSISRLSISFIVKCLYPLCMILHSKLNVTTVYKSVIKSVPDIWMYHFIQWIKSGDNGIRFFSALDQWSNPHWQTCLFDTLPSDIEIERHIWIVKFINSLLLVIYCVQAWFFQMGRIAFYYDRKTFMSTSLIMITSIAHWNHVNSMLSQRLLCADNCQSKWLYWSSLLH